MSAVRATLRIARRDAWRHKTRSALVVAMVAIPVLGLSAADVLARTMQLGAGERLTREIGQADVGLQDVGGRVTQAADPAAGYNNVQGKVPQSGPALVAAQRAQALALVGAQPGVTTALQTYGKVAAGGLKVDPLLMLVNLGDPLTAGIATVRSGKAPVGPAEVAVTPHLAQRLDLRVGGQLSLAGRQCTVTGIVSDPKDLNRDGVYASPVGRGDPRQPLILAATTHPVTWSEVRALNAIGFLVTSRYVVEHPPADAPKFGGPPALSPDRIGIATVAIGLAVLEVVLLAGAAFAVGARRQRRDLALLAAAGGDARQVRWVVLAGGLVLGVVGGVVGVAAGIGVARISLSETAHLVNHAPGHFDLRPVELLVVTLIGVVTGVIASVLPARVAGREDVVAALTGRRGVIGTRRRIPAIGLAMVVLGAVIAVHAAHRYHFREILAGAVISELGFVVCAPTVVGLVGRLARFLPLAPRLALRDAARHRGRSGPAVAAIMAAIAGSIAVSTYFVSTVQRDRQDYIPQGRIGQPLLLVSPGGAGAVQRGQAAVAAFREDLGASQVIPVPIATCVEINGHCKNLLMAVDNIENGNLAIGDAALLRLLSGRTDPGAEAALAAGKVVAFSRRPTTLYWESVRHGGETRLAGVSLYLDDLGKAGASFDGIVTPATAARLHFGNATWAGSAYLGLTPSVPSQAQEDRLDDQLPRSATVWVERGYSPGGYSIGLIALVIAAGLVTLGATAVSVGLSMAESKPDLVTLAAVGGRPRTRRLLVANQAGAVALLGAVQGVVAGVIPAWAILHAARVVPFVLPWTTILVVVVGIPLVAMVGTAAFAGSQLTLDRRST